MKCSTAVMNKSSGKELLAGCLWYVVSKWDRESNEETYRRFGMNETAVGMDCGVVEWVKRSTLRWYGHVMRMNECDCRKRV